MKTHILLAGATALLLTAPAFAQPIGGGAGQVGAAGAAPGSVPLDAPAVPGVPRNRDSGLSPSDRAAVLAGAEAAKDSNGNYTRASPRAPLNTGPARITSSDRAVTKAGAAAAGKGPHRHAKAKTRRHVAAHHSASGRAHVPAPTRRGL